MDFGYNHCLDMCINIIDQNEMIAQSLVITMCESFSSAVSKEVSRKKMRQHFSCMAKLVKNSQN